MVRERDLRQPAVDRPAHEIAGRAAGVAAPERVHVVVGKPVHGGDYRPRPVFTPSSRSASTLRAWTIGLSISAGCDCPDVTLERRGFGPRLRLLARAEELAGRERATGSRSRCTAVSTTPVHVGVLARRARRAEIKAGDLKVHVVEDVGSACDAQRRWIAWWRRGRSAGGFSPPRRTGRVPLAIRPSTSDLYLLFRRLLAPFPAPRSRRFAMTSPRTMLLCDFHIHTTYSDGILPLPEVVDLFGRSGHDVIAITDHIVNRDNGLGRIAHRIRHSLECRELEALRGGDRPRGGAGLARVRHGRDPGRRDDPEHDQPGHLRPRARPRARRVHVRRRRSHGDAPRDPRARRRVRGMPPA